MKGNTELYTSLNVTAITDLLTKYSTVPGIFADTQIPNKFNGVEVKATDTFINYYPIGLFNGALDYGQYPYQINCRAKTYYESRTLAETVFDTINRHGSGYFIVGDLLPTISPQDETDCYNTPIAVTIKTTN